MSENKMYRLSGQVIDVSDPQQRRGVMGLRVDVIAKGSDSNRPFVSTVTLEGGLFRLELSDASIQEAFKGPRPDFYFKVFSDNTLIRNTEDSLVWRLTATQTDLLIEVKMANKEDAGKTGGISEFIVRGRVREEDGSAASELIVRAFDKDLRHEQELGRTTTDAKGNYEIRYTAAQFRRAEKGNADLIVRTMNKRNEVIAASPLIFHAQPLEVVNLFIGGQELPEPSEYEQILASYMPLLEGTAIIELNENEQQQDITFLSKETGHDPQRIALTVIAQRLTQTTHIPAEIYYGFFRYDLPTDLPSLLSLSRDVLRAALADSLRDNIIPRRLEDKIDSILDALLRLSVQHALEPPADNTHTTLGNLLNISLKSKDKQAEFLNSYFRHQGTAEEFWEKLRARPEFKNDVSELQFTLQLGVLTQNHLPLVKELKQRREAGQLASLRDMARFDMEAWKEIIGSGTQAVGMPPGVPGKTQEEKRNNYALTLTRMMEDAFPTTAIAGRISKSNLAGKEDLNFFFSSNLDFEFNKAHVESYLAEKAEGLEQVTDQRELALNLQNMQRVFNMTPRFDEMQVLLDDGLTSAHAVTRISRSNFVESYGVRLGGAERAKVLYENAEQISATSLNLVAAYAPWFNNVGLYVLPPMPAQVEGMPNLETLFGSLNMCACEHCRSVYSPAAYLVDILHFLKDRPSKVARISAKDILFRRRPDIGEIELTCENSNTPLPYIDLVNELLENAVSPETAIANRTRQTTNTAQELAANPQFINPGAYNKLAANIYPWLLPFNLWAEEARSYLAYLGVPRYELMRKFQRSGPPADPTAHAIAGEYLGLTTTERQAITGTLNPARSAWEFWGLQQTGNQVADPANPSATLTLGWLQVINRVRLFLNRTQLSYEELEELLKLKFINPSGAITIVSLDREDPNTCDTAQLGIANLDEAAAERIQKFVRLWRKLGWTMRELDKIITALQPSELTNDFILMLAHLKQLCEELNVPVTLALSWYARLDTAQYADTENPKQKSLYEERFQNLAVIKLNPGETDPFALNSARTELNVTGVLTIADTDTSADKDKKRRILAALSGALGISDIDLNLLIRGEHAVVTSDKALNLENLSRLFRYATFARALKLSIEEFLQIINLIGINPFVNDGIAATPNDTRNTLRVIEVIGKIRASGFRIEQLNYLLRHKFNTTSDIAPTDESIALMLDEIRAGLHKIHEETTIAPDPDGEVTARKLALLKWDTGHIEEVVKTLKGSVVYSVTLNVLPAGLIFPNEVKEKVSYNADARKLNFNGPMTLVERAALLGLSGDASYQAAVGQLFDAPRNLVAEKTKAFSWPPFAAPLLALPAGVVFPSEMKGRIFYDKSAQGLKFNGLMTEAEKSRLLGLSGDASYQAAVNLLFNAPAAFVPAPANQFLGSADISQLFDTTTDAAARFESVLKKLLAYLRLTLSEGLVKQQLGAAFQLDSNVMELLLSQWVHSPTHPSQKAMTEFLAPAFAESDLNVRLTAASFPDQFKSFILLHKIAAVIFKFKITAKQIPWVFFDAVTSNGYASGTSWLNLASLPLDAAFPVSFAKWERLMDLFHLRDTPPFNESVLDDIFRLARTTGTTQTLLFQRLSEHTRWAIENLEFLAGAQGFNLTFPAAYLDERALTRLQQAFALMKRLGVFAEQCRAWAQADINEADARSIKQAVKAKYEDEQWLAIARPLRDVLREKQRAALVAYLLARPFIIDGGRQLAWKDAAGMYEYFLIDVEMSSCQLTSRIKQANSSVQLFVQRCLLNLERDVAANVQVDKKWSEWKWMKNYRVWEANRKIFLYPENWIEPDLRDDKSPFFKELESDLLQNEVTLETAENGFLSYLEKLDEVARLEIVGMYHQIETDQQGNRVIDHLHVFGRTHATPHLYYYRRRVDDAHWTAWEKLDVDIEGDHVIPVVWNRRLHVFWVSFTEKTIEEPLVIPAPGQAMKEPVKYFEIELAWSEFKNRKWSAKKISNEKLRTNNLWVTESQTSSGGIDRRERREVDGQLRKDAYTFKAQFYPDGDLAIACYAKTQITEIVVISQTITIVVPFTTTSVTSNTTRKDDPQLVAEFRATCQGEFKANVKLNPILEMWGKLLAPTRTTYNGMFLTEHNSNGELYVRDTGSSEKALSLTPGRFTLVYPHQDIQFTARHPFFFQDNTRTFFVSLKAVQIPFWWMAETIVPDLIYQLPPLYYLPLEVITNPADPVINPADPPLYEVSFPQEFGYMKTPLLNGLSTPTPREGALAEVARADSKAVLAEAVKANYNVGVNHLLLTGQSPPVTTTIPHYYTEEKYLFQTFYHPYVCLFMRELNRDGVDGLLQRRIQTAPHTFAHQPSRFDFDATYDPKPVVTTPYPEEEVDFGVDGAYAQYNWELFFHVPLLIADRLSKNQRFEDAQKWFHYIFDPTDTSAEDSPQKYWRVGRFFETSKPEYQAQQLRNILQQLASGTPDTQFDEQVRQWRANPFNPHLIARLRTTAYQKTVVMKYIDNLIAWGDQLFRRDTLESINEATQLYVLAAGILGRRPEEIKPRHTPQVQTYNMLEPRLRPDDFSNPLVAAENLIGERRSRVVSIESRNPPLSLPPMLYFCVPKNDKLLGYWDLVADRLFKIRHCMNIEGVVRQLPLFEPPIDPALLVKAAAAGIDISTALGDINAALPHYRFATMVQKATELCNDLKALGAALLSALEKRDAEALALLRSSHEIKVLNAARSIKEYQINEAKETIEGLKKYRDVVTARLQYYSSREFLNIFEIGQLLLSGMSLLPMLGQTTLEVIAGVLHLLPNAKVGTPTTIGVTYGGANIASGLQSFASALGTTASMLNIAATLSGVMGGHMRRQEEWVHQANLAAKELEQVGKQIAAAEIRKAIAETDLRNHDLQVENAKETNALMQDKFTNRELYDWMVSQISGIYFQSYQLVYDIAKRTERAYSFELGLQNSNFIQFGYWDSLKKGLLAGERLHHDLKRLEMSYYDQNRREYELTKHISLAMLDPVALMMLKETGECYFDLPEAIFDLDHAGHYMRRIKTVGLTIPCVTGPYTGINGTLTLLSSSMRKTTTTAGGYARTGPDDLRFMDNISSIQSVAISGAQNDSGVFELSFRDERYLPFEGGGVVSRWRLRLAKEFPQFDYDTITDVILHMRYTAREGGDGLRDTVLSGLKTALNESALAQNRKGLFRLFSLRHEFPTEWHQFLSATETVTGDHVQRFPITKEHFPYFIFTHAAPVKINQVHLLAHLQNGTVTAFDAFLTPAGTAPNEGNDLIELEADSSLGGMLHKQKLYPVGQEKSVGAWTLRIKSADFALIANQLENIFILFAYAI